MLFLRLSMFLVAAFGAGSVAQASYEHLCKTHHTELHYAKTKCLSLVRALPTGANFNLQVLFIEAEKVPTEQAPTLIFVPGGPGEKAAEFKYFLDKRYLVNALFVHMGLNVVFFDPRGTGDSKVPSPLSQYGGDSFSTETGIQDLRAVIQEVSPGKPVFLLSHSAGAVTALGLAAENPEMVQGMMLISPIVDIKDLATLQSYFYGKEFSLWKDFLKTVPVKATADELGVLYDFVEDALSQQEKARILRMHVNRRFPDRTTFSFRKMMLRLSLVDPTGGQALVALRRLAEVIMVLDAKSPVASPELRALRLNAESLPLPDYQQDLNSRGFIRSTILCREGLDAVSRNEALYLDGLTMQVFCRNLRDQKESKISAPIAYDKIRTPITILTGETDSDVPPMLQQRLLRLLPNAQQVIAKGAGHLVVDTNPVDFYNPLEKLVQKK